MYIFIDKEINRDKINKQIDTQIDRSTDRKIDRQIYRQIEIQIDRQGERCMIDRRNGTNEQTDKQKTHSRLFFIIIIFSIFNANHSTLKLKCPNLDFRFLGRGGGGKYSCLSRSHQIRETRQFSSVLSWLSRHCLQQN